MGHCHEEKKNCKKCVEKHVIRCLPYYIHKSGHYCLGKDFTWANPEKSAITITNTENVVLDFNDRKITVTADSEEVASSAVVTADNVTDLVLNDVHIKAIGQAKNSRGGLAITNSCDVDVNRPVLLDLGSQGFFTESHPLHVSLVKGITIQGLYLKNDEFPAIGINIVDSSNIVFKDSKMDRARLNVLDSQNIAVDNVSVQNETDEDPGSVGRCFQFFDVGGPPIQNVQITNCNVVSNNYGILFGGGQGILIENNTVRVENLREGAGGVFGIYTDSATSVNICNNAATTKGHNSIGVLSAGCKSTLIEKNSVYGSNNFGACILSENDIGTFIKGNVVQGDFTTDAPAIGSPGILVSRFGLGDQTGSYNTVSDNVATQCLIGFSDGFQNVFDITNAVSSSPGVGRVTYTTAAPHGFTVGERATVSYINPDGFQVGGNVVDVPTPTTFVLGNAFVGAYVSSGFAQSLIAPSFCTVFKDNVATGNVRNFTVNTSAPINTTLQNNIDKCPVVLNGASLAKSVKRKVVRRSHKITKDDL